MKDEKRPIIYDDNSTESLFDLDFMIDGKGKGLELDNISQESLPAEPPKRKRGRPRKNKENNNTETIVIDAGGAAILDNNHSNQPLPMTQSNEPYLNTYSETNQMLNSVIAQIDGYSMSIAQDLNTIRASKTLKNKYNYITDLTATGGQLIGNKITAIRELNKTITDSHNLELKRLKDVTAANAAGETDEKYIMDMYNAFIQTPTGNNYSLGPGPMALQSANSGLIGVPMQGQLPGDYDITPEQNRMRLEGNPNIKTVLVLNSTTGERYFDVIDTSTGNSVPNMPKPDPMFLEDTIPYPNEGVARNTNLDITYPLIIIDGGSLF